MIVESNMKQMGTKFYCVKVLGGEGGTTFFFWEGGWSLKSILGLREGTHNIFFQTAKSSYPHPHPINYEHSLRKHFIKTRHKTHYRNPRLATVLSTKNIIKLLYVQSFKS